MKKRKIVLIILVLLYTVHCGKPQDRAHDHEAEHRESQQAEVTAESGDDHGEADHDYVHVSEQVIRQWGIKYEVVEERDYREHISLTGVVQEDQSATYRVNALVTGTVSRIRRDIGDAVQKGEVLGVLNSPQFLEIKTRYIKAFQEFRLCRESRERAKRLYDIKGIELRELQKREAACKTAMAEYFSLEAELLSKGTGKDNLESVKEALDKDQVERVRDFISADYLIFSPLTGKVVQRDLRLGERVESGRPLFEVSDTRRVWVILDALEKDLKLIKKGARVEVVTDSYPGELFAGRLINIMAKVDPEVRTVKLRVEVENPRDLLRPEMYVTGRIEGEAGGKYPAVPVQALVKIAAVNGVFVRETDGFRFAPLERLGSDSAGLVFVRGLAAGESIVTRGAFYLKAEYEVKRDSGTDSHAGHGH
jgi:RND family efflux transporter MFP subunit